MRLICFFCEITNVLWKRARRRDIESTVGKRALQTFLGLDIKVHATAPLTPLALKLALTIGCSVYDALYLVLAVERGCRFVTADRRFYDSISIGVPADDMVWVEDID